MTLLPDWFHSEIWALIDGSWSIRLIWAGPKIVVSAGKR